MTEPAPHHRLHVRGRRGALRLDAELALTAPWTVLFGPSGSGKSSLLRAACGLLSGVDVRFSRREPDGSWTELQGESRSLPPNWRGLSYAPQSVALFPHLTVRRNIAFGARGSDKAAVARALQNSIELFGMAPLLDRRPLDLSGGERQGVSLARAFALPAPRLVLLDEPFSGIDHANRDALLPRMRDHLAARAIPALSVTHNVEEALLLDAYVYRMDAGRILAHGPAEEVLAEERHRMLRTLKSPIARE